MSWRPRTRGSLVSTRPCLSTNPDSSRRCIVSHRPLARSTPRPTLVAMTSPTILTIGNFDGVHLGHQALVRSARALAGPKGRVLVRSFDPHPLTQLQPDQPAPGRLTTMPDRARLLMAAGADTVTSMVPTTEMLDMSPEKFVRWIVEQDQPGIIVEGESFRFGKGRSGDVHTLSELGTKYAFTTEIVGAVQADLADQSIVNVSSTMIRWLLKERRVDDAARLLGRPYCVTGKVVEGDQRGRQVGIPTANLVGQTMLPGRGVYAGRATLDDGREYAAAINVGVRPTFESPDPRLICETHLIDYDGPPDHYGWLLELQFVAFLRDEIRFSGPQAVARQIRRDIARVAELIGSQTTAHCSARGKDRETSEAPAA